MDIARGDICRQRLLAQLDRLALVGLEPAQQVECSGLAREVTALPRQRQPPCRRLVGLGWLVQSNIGIGHDRPGPAHEQGESVAREDFHSAPRQRGRSLAIGIGAGHRHEPGQRGQAMGQGHLVDTALGRLQRGLRCMHRFGPLATTQAQVGLAPKRQRLQGRAARLARQRGERAHILGTALGFAAPVEVLGAQVEQLGLLLGAEAACGEQRRGARDGGLGLAGPGQVVDFGHGARRLGYSVRGGSRALLHFMLPCAMSPRRAIACAIPAMYIDRVEINIG